MDKEELEGFKAAIIVIHIGLGFLIGCKVIEIIGNIIN
jgi:hypothetical protein